MPGDKITYEFLGRFSSTFDIIHWKKWKQIRRMTTNPLLQPLTTHNRGAEYDLQCTMDAILHTMPKQIHYIMQELTIAKQRTPVFKSTLFSDDDMNSTENEYAPPHTNLHHTTGINPGNKRFKE
jgi:hypothetical protein